jgi:hypothetical protein
MSELNTDFSVSPYFDDYDEDKQFYRILFRPRTAVQARELTQLQTILQKQISRFGNHIFRDGSVVDGVAITYIPRFEFVHLENTFNGANLSVVTDIANTYLITNSLDSNTAVRAVPVIAKNGFVSAYPDTNRIYLRYISTGKDGIGNDQSTFISGDTLYIFNAPQNKFETLDSNNVIETIDVITSNGTANATGIAYGMSVSDGIVYQKGHFVKVDSQTITVKDFDRNVDNYVVGFDTREFIVNSAQDVSLKDQSAGFPNFNAPGADRLKLTPTLFSIDKDQLSDDNQFFAIVEFDGFEPAQQSNDPVYNKLGEEFSRRTFEKSGDFYVKPFQIEAIETANTQEFSYEVSTGISYINGYRVEFVGTNRIITNRALDTKVSQNQVVTANYGEFVVVDEFLGSVDIDNISEIDIRDQAQNSISEYEGISGSPSGNIVGKANVKNIVYKSGKKGSPDARYVLYIFNIRMNTGKNFQTDAKSFTTATTRGDFVLEDNKTIIKDANKRKLVFDTGQTSIKRLTDSGGVNDTSYVYRQTSSATLQSNGFATFTTNTPAPGATESLNFSVGNVSELGKRQFNISLTANAFTSNSTGTINVVSGNTTIVGTSTLFDTEFADDDLIRVNIDGSNFVIRRIEEVVNSTVIVVDTAISTANAAANFQKFFVSGTVLDLSSPGAVNVISNTQFQISTGLTLDSGTQSTFGQYPVIRNLAIPITKNIRRNRTVKIDANTNPANTVGPWNLGLVDVANIKNIWLGTTYSDTNPDRSEWFILDNGQKDDYYEHARLFVKPQFASRVTSSTKLLINLDHFEANTSAGVGFFSVDSYPVDDTFGSNTQITIKTGEIPRYIAGDGKTYDLRNVLDFRPQKFNTANSVANTNPANTFISENPASSNNTFKVASGGQYLIEADSNFRADIEYYLPRIDLITVDKDGTLYVKQGTPEENPRTPVNDSDSSVIAQVIVPGFPSLTQREAERVNRRDLAVRITPRGNKRYTMRDVGLLEKRIRRLEYYTVLNALEQQARDLTIPDENGLDRFKNGIFADPFSSHDIGKVSDFEYSIAIDKDNGIARPTYTANPVDFAFDQSLSSNVVRVGPYVMLPYDDELYIKQPFATKFRNATELEWQWNGDLDLYPEYDYFRDEQRAPNLNVELDLAAPWEEFANSPFGTVFGDWRTVSEEVRGRFELGNRSVGARPGGQWGGIERDFAVFSNQVQRRTVSDLSVNVLTSEYDFGTYVSDFSIQPYMRSRTIAFIAFSLKPNTRIFAYFDDKPVSQHCAPGVLSGITNFYQGNEDKIVERTGNYGTQLVTDSNGFICGIFKIPAGEFRTGDRRFLLTEVNDLETGGDASLTKASAVFHATNVSVTKQSTTLTTREPGLIFGSNQEIRNISTSRVDTTFTPNPPPPPPAQAGGGGKGCPLSQSFRITSPSNSTGVFMTEIGLFFRTKDPTLGCTVFVMEMRGGYPDISNIIGKSHLTSAEINAPGNNDQVETKFVFERPLYLTKDKNYAFMVYPDATSPEYTFWLAELGGVDVTTGQQISQNPYSGNAFRSSNQLTWSAIQEEQVKFNLYRARFTASSGTAVFENENDEYIVVDGFTRANSSLALDIGDVVYTVNATSNTVMIANTDPFGVIQTIDEGNGFIQLDDSRGGFVANTEIRVYRVSNESNTSLIVANNLIASAIIQEVKNIPYQAIVPRFSKMEPANTTLKFQYKGMGVGNILDSTFSVVQSDTETEFFDKLRFAYSKSNETGTKSSRYNITLNSTNSLVSPVIDLGRKASLMITNNINNDATNEHTRYGNALAKYISKNVVLADGQESEDLHIYLTAYRPVNTDIQVYVKFYNEEDSEPFESKLWTKLDYFTGEGTFSNPTDPFDYNEYEFRVPTTAAFPNSAFRNTNGVVEYTNEADSIFLGFKSYSIKIVLLSLDDVRVPRLNDARGIALQV